MIRFVVKEEINLIKKRNSGQSLYWLVVDFTACSNLSVIITLATDEKEGNKCPLERVQQAFLEIRIASNSSHWEWFLSIDKK